MNYVFKHKESTSIHETLFSLPVLSNKLEPLEFVNVALRQMSNF